MALITTIEEVKQVLRVSNLNYDSSLPDFESAGQTHLKPILGATLYDALDTAYNESTLTALQTSLLKKCRKPLVALAFIDDEGFQNVVMTDAGWRQAVTADMPAAFKWQVDRLISSLEKRASNAIEELYQFLLENQVELAWSDSDRKKYLITNGNEFNDCYSLYHPLRTYSLLRPVMSKVEDKYVKPLIGDEYLAELKGLAAPTTEEKEVIRLLRMAVAHLTIKHASETLPVRKWEGGFTVLNTTSDTQGGKSDQQPAAENLIALERSAADRDGQEYLKDAKRYLNKYASVAIFANYFASDYYTAPGTDSTESKNANKKTFRF
jgi:hypothetical protein